MWKLKKQPVAVPREVTEVQDVCSVDENGNSDPWGLIDCHGLAEIIRRGVEKVLVIDSRSFLEFNTAHIQQSINVCCSKLVKRRLQQDKVHIKELLTQTCHIDTEERWDVIVYDQCTEDPCHFTNDNFVYILLHKLAVTFNSVTFLKGGFLAFQAMHPSLCESKSTSSYKCAPLTSLSQPCLPVSNVGPTRILPFLYLGSQRDALSQEIVQVNGITYILNVSNTCPKPAFIQDSHFFRIPVNDNYSEKLLPFFQEAFQFLDKVREANGCVLVHCLAGISRSPTLAIAYIMKHMRMSSDDAYRYVKDKRPTISPNFNFLGQLLEFEKQVRKAEEEADKRGNDPACKRRDSRPSPFVMDLQLCSPSSPVAKNYKFPFSFEVTPVATAIPSQAATPSVSDTAILTESRSEKVLMDTSAQRNSQEKDFAQLGEDIVIAEMEQDPVLPVESESVLKVKHECVQTEEKEFKEKIGKSPIVMRTPFSLSLSPPSTKIPMRSVFGNLPETGGCSTPPTTPSPSPKRKHMVLPGLMPKCTLPSPTTGIAKLNFSSPITEAPLVGPTIVQTTISETSNPDSCESMSDETPEVRAVSASISSGSLQLQDFPMTSLDKLSFTPCLAGDETPLKSKNGATKRPISATITTTTTTTATVTEPKVAEPVSPMSISSNSSCGSSSVSLLSSPTSSSSSSKVVLRTKDSKSRRPISSSVSLDAKSGEPSSPMSVSSSSSSSSNVTSPTLTTGTVVLRTRENKAKRPMVRPNSIAFSSYPTFDLGSDCQDSPNSGSTSQDDTSEAYMLRNSKKSKQEESDMEPFSEKKFRWGRYSEREVYRQITAAMESAMLRTRVYEASRKARSLDDILSSEEGGVESDCDCGMFGKLPRRCGPSSDRYSSPNMFEHLPCRCRGSSDPYQSNSSISSSGSHSSVHSSLEIIQPHR